MRSFMRDCSLERGRVAQYFKCYFRVSTGWSDLNCLVMTCQPATKPEVPGKNQQFFLVQPTRAQLQLLGKTGRDCSCGFVLLELNAEQHAMSFVPITSQHQFNHKDINLPNTPTTPSSSNNTTPVGQGKKTSPSLFPKIWT